MNNYDYVIYKPELNEDTLAHYGVKGMKWRKVKAKISSLKNKNKKKNLSPEEQRRKDLEYDARVNRYTTKDANKELEYINDKLLKKYKYSKNVPALYDISGGSRWTSRDVNEAYEDNKIKRKKKK